MGDAKRSYSAGMHRRSFPGERPTSGTSVYRVVYRVGTRHRFRENLPRWWHLAAIDLVHDGMTASSNFLVAMRLNLPADLSDNS